MSKHWGNGSRRGGGKGVEAFCGLLVIRKFLEWLYAKSWSVAMLVDGINLVSEGAGHCRGHPGPGTISPRRGNPCLSEDQQSIGPETNFRYGARLADVCYRIAGWLGRAKNWGNSRRRNF